MPRWAHWAAVVAASSFVLGAGCARDDYTRLYDTSPRAPSFTDEDVQSLDVLGATRVDRGVNFAAYSEHATRIDLLLFDDPESRFPSQQLSMERFGDVWNLYVEGIGLGQHYGYIAWGPNWPVDPDWYPGSVHGFIADVDADGNRFNPNKLLLDPYAKAVHRDFDWSKGSTASGPDRTVVTYGAAAKSVVVESAYEWSEGEATWRASREDPDWVGHRWNDLIIYEAHPKGFTASPAAGVVYPGTYRGFGEKAAYLQDLGVTAVELMPVHEKPLDGGYWGYQTLGFFLPELSYAAFREREEVIDEFKWMVDQLHQNGVEVILDVVYNHTGEGGLWREKIEQDDVALGDVTLANFDPKEIAGLYAYRGLDNAAYYALTPDNQEYWNDTGVGNQTRPNHLPMRRLIMDSLRYWADEMHVDGFRFDLAPILGRSDDNHAAFEDPSRTVLQEIVDDPVLRRYNTRVIAEPWAAGGQNPFNLGAFPVSDVDAGVGWYEWNAHFRDVWRDFVNFEVPLNHAEGAVDVGGALTGSSPTFSHNGRRPYHSVNFVTAHDGFPMYDLFTFNAKKNGCGLLNPTCCSNRFSAFCDRDSGDNNNRSRDWGSPCSIFAEAAACDADPYCRWGTGCEVDCGRFGGDSGACDAAPFCRWDAGGFCAPGWEGEDAESFKRQQMRNLFTFTMLSHGTPMIYNGDEWIRTQYGNNNAYSTGADNHWNWLDWGAWEPSLERNRMHDFVRNLIRLRREHLDAFAPATYVGEAELFTWRSPSNGDPDWSGRALMQHYHSTDPELLVLINMSAGWVTFTLPEGRSWQRLVDTQRYFDVNAYFAAGGDPRASANISLSAPEPIPGPGYDAAEHSVAVLVAAP